MIREMGLLDKAMAEVNNLISVSAVIDRTNICNSVEKTEAALDLANRTLSLGVVEASANENEMT
jgi:hypothetical protein